LARVVFHLANVICFCFLVSDYKPRRDVQTDRRTDDGRSAMRNVVF